MFKILFLTILFIISYCFLLLGIGFSLIPANSFSILISFWLGVNICLLINQFYSYTRFFKDEKLGVSCYNQNLNKEMVPFIYRLIIFTFLIICFYRKVLAELDIFTPNKIKQFYNGHTPWGGRDWYILQAHYHIQYGLLLASMLLGLIFVPFISNLFSRKETPANLLRVSICIVIWVFLFWHNL